MDFGLKKPSAAEAGDLIVDTSTATFAKDVLEASRDVPVLVDFWAPWCGPCRQLTPILEKLVRAAKGKIKLVKMNIDGHPAIAGQLRVQSIPAVYAFRDGRPLDGFIGALPESQVKAFIDRLLQAEGADDIEAAIEAANTALEQDDLQTAAEIFAAILKEDSQNLGALAGLARCYLKSGDLERAEQTIKLVPPGKEDSAPIAGVRAAIALKRQADSAGDIDPLRAAVAGNPADHQARYDLAVALAAAGEHGAAVDELMEIMRRDRKWNDEAARKQLVQFFDAWGSDDPVTLDGRRRLSALLFS